MDLLGLADFRVLVVDEHTYDFHFQVVLAAPPLQCVQCGQHKLYRHETKPQLFMDLPIRGKRVGITVQRRRYRCCTCHCTFFEALPCMNESHFMTNRLITYIQQEALRRTFVSIADEVGLAESTIRAVFGEFAATIQPRIPEVQPRDMVDKSTEPFMNHFGPIFGDEAVQRGFLFPEQGSIGVLLRAPSPISLRHTTALHRASVALKRKPATRAK